MIETNKDEGQDGGTSCMSDKSALVADGQTGAKVITI